MGVDYIVANLDLREYFQIYAFGDDDRRPVGFGSFNPDSYLHCYAIAYLVTGAASSSGEMRGRWATHRVEFPSDMDESFYENELPRFTDITALLIDALSEYDEGFVREMLARASREEVWCPITTTLLTLVDAPRYKHFRQTAEWNLRQEWPALLAGLRSRIEEAKRAIE